MSVTYVQSSGYSGSHSQDVRDKDGNLKGVGNCRFGQVRSVNSGNGGRAYSVQQPSPYSASLGRSSQTGAFDAVGNTTVVSQRIPSSPPANPDIERRSALVRAFTWDPAKDSVPQLSSNPGPNLANSPLPLPHSAANTPVSTQRTNPFPKMLLTNAGNRRSEDFVHQRPSDLDPNQATLSSSFNYLVFRVLSYEEAVVSAFYPNSNEHQILPQPIFHVDIPVHRGHGAGCLILKIPFNSGLNQASFPLSFPYSVVNLDHQEGFQATALYPNLSGHPPHSIPPQTIYHVDIPVQRTSEKGEISWERDCYLVVNIYRARHP